MKAYPRNRIVTFRVTEGEYEGIKARCDGARNCVSEFAREAVMGKQAPERDIDRSLAGLEQKVDEILRLLERLNPPRPSQS
jgi:hypothetical protein